MKKQSVLNEILIFLFLASVFIAVIIALVGCSTTDDKHTHFYRETVTNPTCTEQGYTLHTCDCGESYKDSFVAATGHTPKTVRENAERQTALRTAATTKLSTATFAAKN